MQRQRMPSETPLLISVEVIWTLLNLSLNPKFKNYNPSDFVRDQT